MPGWWRSRGRRRGCPGLRAGSGRRGSRRGSARRGRPWRPHRPQARLHGSAGHGWPGPELGAAGPDRVQVGHLAAAVAGGGLAGGGVAGGGGDQLVGGDFEDVAEGGEDGQGQPFGGLGDQPPDLHRGQADAAFGEQRYQVGGVEQAVGGHDFPQPPLVADLPRRRHHRLSFPGARAAVIVASSARRRVRVRKSEDTQL